MEDGGKLTMLGRERERKRAYCESAPQGSGCRSWNAEMSGKLVQARKGRVHVLLWRKGATRMAA